MSHISKIIGYLLLSVMFASSALAASVSVGGNSPEFSVNGTGLGGLYGIQVDINYDPASLGNPTVTKGALASRALFAENHSTRGLIKIAVISNNTFSESGQIATVSFASKTGSGGITSLRYNIIDSSGSSVASSKENQADESESLVAVAPLSPQIQTNLTQPGNGAATLLSLPLQTNTSYPGTIDLTTDPQQNAELRSKQTPPESSDSALPTAVKVAERSNDAGKPASDEKTSESQLKTDLKLEPALPDFSENARTAVDKGTEQTQYSGSQASDEKAADPTNYIVYTGISDRFRQYSGSKRLSDVTKLFNGKVTQTIDQKPAILLSDGMSKAVLTIDLASESTSSPNFAMNGGRLVSLKQDKKNRGRWIVEVLPKADAGKVTVTVICGDKKIEYPLTVSLPAKTSLTLDEQGWKRFLKEVGTSKAPLHDLNKDNVRDYMDEYIFVANYLAVKSSKDAKSLNR